LALGLRMTGRQATFVGTLGALAEIIVVLSGEVAARRGVVLACPAAVNDGD
jgi:hypothetical protein